MVEEKTKVPWYCVGIIHSLEASFNFTKHLHNGDSLTAKTTHVPAGRPLQGTPPFTWEESAIDALNMKKSSWNSISEILYNLESYNGFGYMMHHNINSPYLWAGTNHYTSGKYTSDGKFSVVAVSSQIGAASIILQMINKKLI